MVPQADEDSAGFGPEYEICHQSWCYLNGDIAQVSQQRVLLLAFVNLPFYRGRDHALREISHQGVWRWVSYMKGGIVRYGLVYARSLLLRSGLFTIRSKGCISNGHARRLDHAHKYCTCILFDAPGGAGLG